MKWMCRISGTHPCPIARTGSIIRLDDIFEFGNPIHQRINFSLGSDGCGHGHAEDMIVIATVTVL